MFKNLVLTALLASAPVAANAQGFLGGLVIGGLLFGGGSDQSGGSAATILYSADAEVLMAVDPLEMRMASTRSCFNPYFKFDKTGKSLGELFTEVSEGLPVKERRILQIARVFDPSSPQCAAIWFAYTEE